MNAYEEYHEDSNSALTLESIMEAVIASPIGLYSINVEYPYYLNIRLNNAEEIYFGYSQEGDDGFTWELTHQGSTIALGAMPNQANAEEVAKELYSWLSTVPQCLDCTAFIGYQIETFTTPSGLEGKSVVSDCPNCGVSYDTNADDNGERP